MMYVCTKWVAPNKGCGKFSVHWFNQVHYSITASKKNVVVFFQFEYAEFSGYARFFRFRPQYHFWVNLVHKIKIISLFWNLAPGLIPICRIQW